MVKTKVKKSPEKIKESILDFLKEGPKTIADISGAINSNWLTIEKFLKELSGEGKVREVISTEKKKIYQIITGDTYFNVPINENQREKFKKVFSSVLKEYKQRTTVPNKTQLAKSAVYVINELNQQGENLPMMWYLYGMIPLMIADLRQDYSTNYVFETENFNTLIKKGVDEFIGRKASEIQDLQYAELKNNLYKIKNNIFKCFSSPEKNAEKISSLLTDFLINTDSNEDPDIFIFAEEFTSLFEQFNFLNKLNKDEIKRELLLTFDSLWEFIAINQALNSLVEYGYSKKDLKDFYLGSIIETKKLIIKEKLSNLNSIYLSLIPEKIPEINLSKEAQDTIGLFENWD